MNKVSTHSKIYSQYAGKPSFSIKKSKLNNKDWGMFAADYIIGLATSLHDNSLREELLKSADGDISMKAFNYILQPYGKFKSKDVGDFAYPGSFHDTSLIKDILLKLLTEYAVLPNPFMVTVEESDITLRQDASLNLAFSQYVEQYVINLMNEQGMNTGQESVELPPVEDLIEDLETSYFRDLAIDAQDRLNLFKKQVNDAIIYADALFYWLVLGEYYVFRDIQNGVVNKICVHPLECFPIYDKTTFVDDYRGFVRVFKASLEDLAFLYDKLDDNDLAYLKKVTDEFSDQHGTVTVPITAFNNFDTRFKSSDYIQYIQTLGVEDVNFASRGEFTVYHIVHKFLFKIGTLTYVDPATGIISTRLVYDDYKFTKEAGDIDIKWDNKEIPLQCYRIGPKGTGLYTKFEPLNILHTQQGEVVSKLNYSGKRFLLGTSFNHSIVSRLLLYEMRLRVINLAIERELNKALLNGDVELVPESLLTDGLFSRDEKVMLLYVDGKLYYDDTNESQIRAAERGWRRVPGREPQLLKLLIEFHKVVKDEAWSAIGWNRQRDGHIYASDGKGVTNQAIFQSTLSTGFILDVFNSSRANDYNLDISWTQLVDILATKNEALGSVVENGKSKRVFIDGLVFALSKFNVNASSSAKDAKSFDTIMQLAFSAAQNGEFDVAAEAALADNIAKLQNLVDEYKARIERKRMEELEAKSRGDAATQEARLEVEKEITNRDVQVQDMKNKSAKEIKQMEISNNVSKSSSS
jgi:hypothetical protein